MKPIILTFGGKRLVAPSGKAIFRYDTETRGGVTAKTVKDSQPGMDGGESETGR